MPMNITVQPPPKRMSSNNYIGWEIIAILSLPPLLVGLLIWWLAMRRKGETDQP